MLRFPYFRNQSMENLEGGQLVMEAGGPAVPAISE
jgi:hypothetical protein